MALVQHNSVNGTGTAVTSQAVTFASNTTTGNTIIVAVNLTTTTAAVSSISDGIGNSYIRAQQGTTNNGQEIWYAENITGGTTPTITVNFTSSSAGTHISEYSGLLTSSSLDNSTSNNGTGTALSSGTALATTANSLVYGVGYVTGSSNTLSAGSGFGNAFTSQYGVTGVSKVIVEDQIVSGSGSYAATATAGTSAAWQQSVAIFKATSPPPSIVTGNPMGLLLALTYASGSASNASVAQVAATVTATGGTQSQASVNNVAITQSGATVTASGGTAAVTTVNNAAISQVSATVTAGGTEVITAHTNSLQNNVASYWKFDDASGSSVADSTGGNTGTWQGTLGSQWGTGQLNGDGVFNGTDNYVAVGDKANLSFGSGNYTLSAWVKTTATARQTVLHKYQYTGTSVESGYYIDMLATGTIRTVFETTNANLRNTDSSIAINDGNWHLITVVRPSTTGDPLLYIDGTLDSGATHAFDAGTPGSIDNTIPFAIGQSISSSIGVNNWNGQIDEVGIWNRDLTSTEVTTLYNSGVGQQYPFGNVAIRQVAATVTATGGTQASTAFISTSVTQLAATVTATGGTQTITGALSQTIAQVAATVTATGGTEVVAGFSNASITQVAATVTATGGTESLSAANRIAITQVAATVTATGGTETLATINNVSISQLAATITATGGTAVMGSVVNASLAQVAATVTATGGTQVIASSNKVSIIQVAATVTATGGTQSSAAMIRTAVTQLAATVTATGGTQGMVAGSLTSVSITQVAATVTVTGGIQAITTLNYAVIERSTNLTLTKLPDIALQVEQQVSVIVAQMPKTTAITLKQPDRIDITLQSQQDNLTLGQVQTYLVAQMPATTTIVTSL